jgi:predicted metal-dependent hydrolase
MEKCNERRCHKPESKLAEGPTDIIDYTILPELCHLKIKEHSHRVWDLVHRFMPDNQEKIEWLKVNGTSLL